MPDGVSPRPGRGRGRGRARGIPAPYLERNPPALARRGGGRSLAASAPLRGAPQPPAAGRMGKQQRSEGAVPSPLRPLHLPGTPSAVRTAPTPDPLHLRAKGSSLSAFHLAHPPPLGRTGFFISLRAWWSVSASCALYAPPSPPRPSSALSNLLPASVLSPLPYLPLLSLSNTGDFSLQGLRVPCSPLPPPPSIPSKEKEVG